MKYAVLTLSLFILQFGHSQTMKDFFTNKTQVVFLGCDYTQAKFIGKAKFPKADGLKNHAMKSWNRLLATEPGKYSLQDAFGLKDKYYYNSINYFLKRNSKIDVASNITDDDYTLSEEDVRKNIATYSTFEKEGLGVSFIVESYNDTKGEAHVWVAYISLSDNKVIYLEKMIGKPGGLGQVNFWARSTYNLCTQIEKKADELKKK